MRDITLEDTIYYDFTTRTFATGVPGTLSDTPELSVLKENSNTPITAGVSVSVNRASVVGLNMATIVATAVNGYENGKSYSIYVSTGTIDGVSAVGEIVGQFTIRSSAAAVDLANATDGLGALKTLIDAILTDTGTSLPATLSIIAAYVDTLETRLSVARADYLDNLNGHIPQTADHTSSIASIKTDLDNSTDGLGALKTLLDTVKAATDLIATTAATESYAVDGTPATLVQLNYMMWSILNSLKFTNTTGISRKLDGLTTAMEFTLDDPDNPTEINRTG